MVEVMHEVLLEVNNLTTFALPILIAINANEVTTIEII
jgi:hypothetical protein